MHIRYLFPLFSVVISCSAKPTSDNESLSDANAQTTNSSGSPSPAASAAPQQAEKPRPKLEKQTVFQLKKQFPDDYILSASANEGSDLGYQVYSELTFWKNPSEGRFAVYRCTKMKGAPGDLKKTDASFGHFFSKDSTCEGHSSEGLVGYLDGPGKNESDRVPSLARYRCFQPKTGAHKLDRKYLCEQGGWQIENSTEFGWVAPTEGDKSKDYHAVYELKKDRPLDYLLSTWDQEGLDESYAIRSVLNFWSAPAAGRFPVYRCEKTFENRGHFYSKDEKCEGHELEGLLGYLDEAGVGSASKDLSLHRCFQPSSGAHKLDLASNCDDDGWQLESQALVGWPAAQPNSSATHLVYQLKKKDSSDYMLSTSQTEGTEQDYAVESQLQFWSIPGNGRFPIFRCLQKDTQARHFFSKDSKCEGHVTESILGYLDTPVNLSSAEAATTARYRCLHTLSGAHKLDFKYLCELSGWKIEGNSAFGLLKLTGADSSSATHTVYELENANPKDFMLSIWQHEGKDLGYKPGWSSKFWSQPAAGRFAVYRCKKNGTNFGHFFSKESNCEGHQVEGLIGYLETRSPSKDFGTTQIRYRCYHQQNGTHKFSFSSNLCSTAGWQIENDEIFGIAPAE